MSSFCLVALGWFMLTMYDPMYTIYGVLDSQKQMVYEERIFSGMLALLSLFPAMALYWGAQKSGETARALGSLGCIVLLMVFWKLKYTPLFFPLLLLLMLMARPLLLDTTSEKPHTSRLNKWRFFSIFFLCMLSWYIQFLQSTSEILAMIDAYLPLILAIPMALFIPWPTKLALRRFLDTPRLGKVLAVLILCGVMAIPYAMDTYRLEVLLRFYKQKEMGMGPRMEPAVQPVVEPGVQPVLGRKRED